MVNKAEWNTNNKSTFFFKQIYSSYADIPHSNSLKKLIATMAKYHPFFFADRHLDESFRCGILTKYISL